ncbi:MAG TPA: DUF6438 domain-containing protein [Abditibacteriaceae bacterium]
MKKQNTFSVIRTLLVCSLASVVSLPNIMLRAAETAKPDDAAVTEISFHRTVGGFGNGPADEITLYADGTATYIGNSSVEKIGVYHGYIYPREFERLVELINFYKFFSLKSSGPAGTDMGEGDFTTVVMGGQPTTLRMQGFEPPFPVWNIQRSIQGIASEVKWSKIGGGIQGTVRLANGFDPNKSVAVYVQRYLKGGIIASARCDKTGQFEINLPPGDYLLISRFSGEQKKVHVEPGLFTTIALE